MTFGVSCVGAKWLPIKNKWEVHFQDLAGNEFIKEASVFISAVGGVSEPRDVKFKGMETFKGKIFSTARWDHSYDYTGKRMTLIGNGCSAAQLLPNVCDNVAYIKQYILSMISGLLDIKRIDFMQKAASAESSIPATLSLHKENVNLVEQGIKEIDETGVTSSDGVHEDFDWASYKGAQAYLGTYVHNFPNIGILFGPNTFPAHNSALFSCEVQAEFAAKTLFVPLLNRRASVIEIKQQAEEEFIQSAQTLLQGSIFSAGYSNWYINSEGKNSASWPGYASTFWRQTWFPNFADFKFLGGSR
ncbi:hypothetical protein B7463_g11172, partial [Scytalidium lignicola]